MLVEDYFLYVHIELGRRKQAVHLPVLIGPSTTPLITSLASMTVLFSETHPMCSPPIVTMSQG